MKNLDLNGLGVQEMNAEEMNGVNGGWAWLILGLLISECLDRNAPNDFKQGWNDAMR